MRLATMSGVQFDALPYEEGRRWELLEGALIEVSSPTPRNQVIVTRLVRALNSFLESGANRGLAIPDIEFALSDSLRLRPDVSVLLSGKAELLDFDRIPVPGAPDIAIEIISPTERAAEAREKVMAYLRSGTVEVWQLFPKLRIVHIFRADTTTSLDATHSITSEALPGFSVPVSSVFI